MIDTRGPFTIPFGSKTLDFELPPGWSGTVANDCSPSMDMETGLSPQAINAAVENPLAGPPLLALARNRRRIVLVVPDNTRPGPTAFLLGQVISVLERAGCPRAGITVLVALGLHRRLEARELERHLGPVAHQCRVIQHDPSDENNLIYLGRVIHDVPAVISRHVMEADLVLALGVVEPHQYAGFSGAAKTVAIGCAGTATIAATHAPHFLDREGVRIGDERDNPFRQVLDDLADLAGLEFVINIIPNCRGQVAEVAAGPPRDVFKHLAALARKRCRVLLPAPRPLVIAGIPAPKSVNLYQASRAATYLVFSPAPIISRGGIIILAAPCPEGFGRGGGEHAFRERLEQNSSIREVLRACHEAEPAGGSQRAYMLARALEFCRIWVAGSSIPADDLCRAHLRGFDSLESALADVAREPAGSDFPRPSRAWVVTRPLDRIYGTSSAETAEGRVCED